MVVGSIAKYGIPIFGLLVAGLFLREAYATSVGSAGRSFGSGLGEFTQGIGGFGDSINKLGTGIGGGITGLLSPIRDVGSWFGLFTANTSANASGATNPAIGGVVTSGSTRTPNTPTASTSTNTTNSPALVNPVTSGAGKGKFTTPSQSFSGGYTSKPSYGWGG